MVDYPNPGERFLGPACPIALAAILEASGGTGNGDPTRVFRGVAALDTATAQHVGFCEGKAYQAALARTEAGLVLVSMDLAGLVPDGSCAVVCRDPALAFARVAKLFHPDRQPNGRIHPSAVIHPEAVIGEGTEIGPHAVIEAGAEIGRNCRIGPLVLIGEKVVLGEGCVIHSHCSVTHAILGQCVVLHPGARIGQEGFGFAVSPHGRFETMPQLGRVLLGDFVEIGANGCVDRGSQGDTVLGAGTRLDNMVQVAHNVRTGPGCVLVAQVGISGSTTLGRGVQMGGQSGTAGHVSIGDGAQIGAQSGVMGDLEAGERVVGSPAWPARETLRAFATLRRLARKPGSGA